MSVCAAVGAQLIVQDSMHTKAAISLLYFIKSMMCCKDTGWHHNPCCSVSAMQPPLMYSITMSPPMVMHPVWDVMLSIPV